MRDRPGSGMTADDYAAMFRHVVLRLRQKGVENAVTVMTYMGAPNWAAKSWFEKLYPGDDVVDWVAMDPYADDRVQTSTGWSTRPVRSSTNGPGSTAGCSARFPGKPVMVAEWGVFERPDDPGSRSRSSTSVRQEIRRLSADQGAGLLRLTARAAGRHPFRHHPRRAGPSATSREIPTSAPPRFRSSDHPASLPAATAAPRIQSVAVLLTLEQLERRGQQHDREQRPDHSAGRPGGDPRAQIDAGDRADQQRER